MSAEHLCAACGYALEDDGYCNFCGKQTNVRRLFAEDVQAELDRTDNFSRRVPTDTEIDRVRREFGDEFASQLLLRLPDEQRMTRAIAEADHYALRSDK